MQPGRMLTRFEYTLQMHETAITLNKVAVHLGWNLASLEEARPVDWTNLAFSWQPTQSVSVDLVARNIPAASCSTMP